MAETTLDIQGQEMDQNTKQYIVVQIGSEKYGIDIGYIDNIVRMQKITRVPKAQEYFKGVINLRGDVVAVMSCRKKMGLEDDVITDKSRIIILKLEEKGLVGIIVDEVCEVVNLAESQIEAPTTGPKQGKDSFINGIGKLGNTLISLLEINALLEEKEEK